MFTSRILRHDDQGDYVLYQGYRWDIRWYHDADRQRDSVTLNDWSSLDTLEVLTYTPAPEYQPIPLGRAKRGARWTKS